MANECTIRGCRLKRAGAANARIVEMYTGKWNLKDKKLANQADIDELSFEQALGELDALNLELEHGTIALDKAIACYERGSKLAKHCLTLLDGMEARVTQLVTGISGTNEAPFLPASKPADNYAESDLTSQSDTDNNESDNPPSLSRARTVSEDLFASVNAELEVRKPTSSDGKAS